MANSAFTAVRNVTGTALEIDSSGGTVPIISIDAGYIGQTSITTLGTITVGVWTGTLIGSTYGGTGVNNGAATITIGGNHTLIGAFTSAFTFTGNTAVTFPTTGTLATTSSLPTPAALTEVNDTNVTLTLGGTPATALLQATSITAGWTGTLSGTRGGTGVNNGASTITLGGSLTTSGAFASTFTMTAATNVTFPTAGTLATTSQLPTPAALTEVNDTNVTLTLGGTPATALLQATSITAGWTGTLSLARGGTAANLTASNGGIFYSTGSAGAILAGTATANQVLLSGSSTTPAWSTATYPATTTINQILYSSSANTITGLATANSGVLITSSGGVPSISSTLPTVVQTNITELGTITVGVWTGTLIGSTYGGTGVNNGSSTITIGGNHTLSGAYTSTFTLTAATSVTFPTSGTLATTSQLPTAAALTAGNDTNVTLTLGGTPATALLQAASVTAGWTGTLSLARGGTAANLTASNGGIFYSTGSAGAILAGTATANQLLLSGSSGAPAWSTVTHPATTTINQILYSSAANVISGLATANNGVLLTSGSGVPSIGTATVAVGGTGNTTFTAYSVICAGTTATGTFQNVSGLGSSGQVLTSNGASALPTWQAGGGTGKGITAAVNYVSAATPTVNKSYGVASVSNASTGVNNVTFSSAFADVNYYTWGMAAYGAAMSFNNTSITLPYNATPTTTVIVALSWYASGAVNTTYNYVMATE